MKRCGLYTRVSTEDQAQVKDGSLETQMDLLERHVQLKADSTDETWRVAGRYREEGRSGKDMNRPEFQHLLADVRTGKIDVVLCTKFDRISRSVRDFLGFQETLKDAGVAFVCRPENNGILRRRWESSPCSCSLGWLSWSASDFGSNEGESRVAGPEGSQERWAGPGL